MREIGAAKAEYFPRISLTGLLGVQSRSLSDLLTGGAGLWTAGLGAAAPIFNAGRTGANVRYAEAVQRELVVNYQRAIYTALRDVSDALAGYRKTAERACRAGAAGRGAGRIRAPVHTAIRRGHRQLPAGARRATQPVPGRARRSRACASRSSASIVQLYRALGGGWNPGDGGSRRRGTAIVEAGREERVVWRGG